MKTSVRTPRFRSLAFVLGLFASSLLCLCAGSMLAVTREGLPRLLYGLGGFAGYVYFFAQALHVLGIPSGISGTTPDGGAREISGRPDSGSDRRHQATASDGINQHHVAA